jgi:hypothetical protein
MNVELFFSTLMKIVEKKEGVKINYKIERKEDV